MALTETIFILKSQVKPLCARDKGHKDLCRVCDARICWQMNDDNYIVWSFLLYNWRLYIVVPRGYGRWLLYSYIFSKLRFVYYYFNASANLLRIIWISFIAKQLFIIFVFMLSFYFFILYHCLNYIRLNLLNCNFFYNLFFFLKSIEIKLDMNYFIK